MAFSSGKTSSNHFTKVRMRAGYSNYFSGFHPENERKLIFGRQAAGYKGAILNPTNKKFSFSLFSGLNKELRHTFNRKGRPNHDAPFFLFKRHKSKASNDRFRRCFYHFPFFFLLFVRYPAGSSKPSNNLLEKFFPKLRSSRSPSGQEDPGP